MSTSLNGKTIACLVATEGVEQVELTEPDTADTLEADKAADSVSASDYAALVLPGGVANPDFLRATDATVAFVKSFFDTGKPVAVICHGP